MQPDPGEARSQYPARRERSALSGPLRVVWLDDLELPESHGRWEFERLVRRYRTLLSLDVAKTRQGGTGKTLEVFNCYGERYCLKAMRPLRGVTLSARELARARLGQRAAFEDEYRCHLAINGTPGFPRLCCRGTYGSGPVIVMEWIEGTPLATLMRQGGRQRVTLGAHDCAAIGVGVARSLARARQRDEAFVHRDISPKNVLIRTEAQTLVQQLARHAFETCLLDFGSSVCGTVREGADATNHIWRNATLEYAPPEMLSHEGEAIVRARLSQKVDVYELCSVLYELYCGQTPFQLASRRIGSAFKFKSYFEPTPLSPRSAGDEGLVRAIHAGLQADPAARPTIEELLGQLEQIAG